MYLSVYKSVNYSYQDVHTITKMWMEAKCPLLDDWIKMCVCVGGAVCNITQPRKRMKFYHLH